MNPSNYDSNEKMLVLHQNIVNLVKQLSMPLVEVSLVISKYINILCETLKQVALENNEKLPELFTVPWPLDFYETNNSESELNLEKVIDVLDNDRIDILDTLIRTSINLEEIPLSDSLLVLHSWEKLVRTQLAKSTSPGQLFSTVELPDDF